MWSGRPAGLCPAAAACRRRLGAAAGFRRVTGRRWSCWGTWFGEGEGGGAGRRGGRGRRRPWLTVSSGASREVGRGPLCIAGHEEEDELGTGVLPGEGICGQGERRRGDGRRRRRGRRGASPGVGDARCVKEVPGRAVFGLYCGRARRSWPGRGAWPARWPTPAHLQLSF